jgi:phage shock protein C
MDTGTVTLDPSSGPSSDPSSAGTRRPPLRRLYEGRMLAGVAAGIADYLGVDVTLVRIGFALLTVMGGAGIPLYLAGLLLIPDEDADQPIASQLIESVSWKR